MRIPHFNGEAVSGGYFNEYMKTHHDAKEITTTYIYGNEHAKHVYEKVGFVETDVVDEPDCHEVNMVYHI